MVALPSATPCEQRMWRRLSYTATSTGVQSGDQSLGPAGSSAGATGCSATADATRGSAMAGSAVVDCAMVVRTTSSASGTKNVTNLRRFTVFLLNNSAHLM